MVSLLIWVNGRGKGSAHVVALEEGEVELVGYVFCNGRLSACRRSSKKEDIARVLFCGLGCVCHFETVLVLLVVVGIWLGRMQLGNSTGSWLRWKHSMDLVMQKNIRTQFCSVAMSSR